MNEDSASPETLSIAEVRGDTPKRSVANPFQLHVAEDFCTWLGAQNASLAFTTYEGAKLIIIGPGLYGGMSVTERNFERCMAIAAQDHRHIWISTHHQVWKLENGLQPGRHLDGWDRVYLPRAAHITGGVDVHDMAVGRDDVLYGVITQYNCIARIGGVRGSFAPVWKPPFITEIIAEDRCHLNGFCLEDGLPAYATAVAATNKNGEWRGHRHDGGIILNVRSGATVATGLAMPHTPRLYRGRLWFLEAARGWFCSLDPATGTVERHLWLPGFLRGLRFQGNYALVCMSRSRDEVFRDLPLCDELAERKAEARCAIEIINLATMKSEHTLEISGAVKELYDICLLENCRQPLLYGIEGNDIRRMVVLGDQV